MESLKEIRAVTTDLPAFDMLRYLLKEKFPGQTVVTASLRSPSVVVLKMVSDIDPATPVVFCHPRSVFPESETYRNQLVKLFGLSNVKVMTQSDSMTGKRAFVRSEKLLNETLGNTGGSWETIHLHDTLAPYKCWIKAVYHERPDEPAEQRVDCYAGMVTVNLLRRRTTAVIDRFMKDHDLPYHPKISRQKELVTFTPSDEPMTAYHF